jgi:hypothetical protein
MFFSKNWFFAATRATGRSEFQRFDARPGAAGQAVIDGQTNAAAMMRTAILWKGVD